MAKDRIVIENFPREGTMRAALIKINNNSLLVSDFYPLVCKNLAGIPSDAGHALDVLLKCVQLFCIDHNVMPSAVYPYIKQYILAIFPRKVRRQAADMWLSMYDKLKSESSPLRFV